MSKKFFIWKDKNCKGINPEWIEIKYPEFKKITDTNKSVSDEDKRWFYRLPPIDDGDEYLVMECTCEEYKKSQVKKEQRKNRKESENEFYEQYDICSFDFVYLDDSGEEYTLHDIVADASVDVEAEAMNNMLNEKLYRGIYLLNEEDKAFILNWIKEKEEGKSNSQIAESIGVTRRVLEYKFSCIATELERFFKKS